MTWIDVTIPMHAGMLVWPGDPDFEITPLQRIDAGDACNTSILRCCTHTGTHADAPWHFDVGGKRLDEVDAQIFFGEALLIDLPDVDTIRAQHLGPGPLPPRVLFKTRNSERSADEPFRHDYVALNEDAAQRLVDDHVRLVGVDYLSVAPFQQSGQATHHILLRNEVFVIEGLRLGGLRAGVCEFVVLPMALRNMDGAPCRAFVRR